MLLAENGPWTDADTSSFHRSPGKPSRRWPHAGGNREGPDSGSWWPTYQSVNQISSIMTARRSHDPQPRSLPGRMAAMAFSKPTKRSSPSADPSDSRTSASTSRGSRSRATGRCFVEPDASGATAWRYSNNLSTLRVFSTSFPFPARLTSGCLTPAAAAIFLCVSPASFIRTRRACISRRRSSLMRFSARGLGIHPL